MLCESVFFRKFDCVMLIADENKCIQFHAVFQCKCIFHCKTVRHGISYGLQLALEAKTYDSLVPTSTCNLAIPGRKGLLKMYLIQKVLLLKKASRSKKG